MLKKLLVFPRNLLQPLATMTNGLVKNRLGELMSDFSNDFQLQLNRRSLVIMLILFSLLIIYILILGVESVITSILSANIFLLVIATLIYYLSLVIRSFRWKLFLDSLNEKTHKSIDYWNTYSLIAFSFSINNIFPLRMGELYRPYNLSQKRNYSLMSSFATVVLERTFDVIFMGGLVVIAGFLQGIGDFANYSDLVGNLIFSAFLVFGFILLLVILSKKETAYLLIKILNNLSNLIQKQIIIDEENTAEKVSKEVTLLLRNRKIIFLGTLSSLIIWLMEGVVFWVVAFSMNINLTFLMAIFILLLSGLIGNSITSASGLGQLPIMVAQLVLLLGISQELALSTCIVYLLIVFWLIVPIGSILHQFTKSPSTQNPKPN